MTSLRMLLSLLSTLPLLASCSGPAALNALIPEDGFRIVRDVPYGEGPRRRLDLYVPDQVAQAENGQPLPLVVFFYGGNWQSGAKEDFLFVGQAFASRGYLTAIPDYRLYPEVRYPAFVEDGAAAVAWLRAHAPRLLADAGAVAEAGANERAVALVGHSAGAYIAAMLAVDEDWLADAGVRTCEAVAAFVGLAGPYDFLPLTDPDLKVIFGPEETRPGTQPVNRIDGVPPPTLLVTGSDDSTVLPANSARLAARARDSGGEVESVSYEGIGHIGLVAALASPLRWLAGSLDDTDAFLRRHPSAGCRDSAPAS